MDLKRGRIFWISNLKEAKEYKENEGHKAMLWISFYSHDVIDMNTSYNVYGHFMASKKIGPWTYHISHEIETIVVPFI